MRDIWRFMALLAFACLLGLAADSSAQVRMILPEPPVASSQRGFTEIVGVRELSDGRLLVADRGENVLYVVDWTTGTINEIGRRGGGPGEFRGISRMYAIGSDSTLLTDSSYRWLILRGTEFVETLPSRRELNQSLGPILYGVDSNGQILDTKGVSWRPGAPIRVDGNADSLAVILVKKPFDDPGLVQIDTLARIASFLANAPPAVACAGSGVAAGMGRSGGRPCVPSPMVAPDQVLLFPDGWVAIAYAERYRVDWRDPTGRWTRGPAIPYEPVPMSDDEKCAAVQGWNFRGLANCSPDALEGSRGRRPYRHSSSPQTT